MPNPRGVPNRDAVFSQQTSRMIRSLRNADTSSRWKNSGDIGEVHAGPLPLEEPVAPFPSHSDSVGSGGSGGSGLDHTQPHIGHKRDAPAGPLNDESSSKSGKPNVDVTVKPESECSTSNPQVSVSHPRIIVIEDTEDIERKQKIAELDSAITAAVLRGWPKWKSPGTGGTMPRREIHDFSVNGVKEGARVDFWRGTVHDDIKNEEWERMLKMCKDHYKRAQARGLSSQESHGNFMEQTIGCAFAAATNGRFFRAGMAMVWAGEAQKQDWKGLWLKFMALGFGPKVPVPPLVPPPEKEHEYEQHPELKGAIETLNRNGQSEDSAPNAQFAPPARGGHDPELHPEWNKQKIKFDSRAEVVNNGSVGVSTTDPRSEYWSWTWGPDWKHWNPEYIWTNWWRSGLANRADDDSYEDGSGNDDSYEDGNDTDDDSYEDGYGEEDSDSEDDNEPNQLLEQDPEIEIPIDAYFARFSSAYEFGLGAKVLNHMKDHMDEDGIEQMLKLLRVQLGNQKAFLMQVDRCREDIQKVTTNLEQFVEDAGLLRSQHANLLRLRKDALQKAEQIEYRLRWNAANIVKQNKEDFSNTAAQRCLRQYEIDYLGFGGLYLYIYIL